MSGSGQKTLPNVRNNLMDIQYGRLALLDVREWSGGIPGCTGVVERPSRMSVSGSEDLTDVRVWSVGPPGCTGVFERLYRLSGSGQEALPEVREWSGDATECPGVVGGPPGCPGGLADDREWLEGSP